MILPAKRSLPPQAFMAVALAMVMGLFPAATAGFAGPPTENTEPPSKSTELPSSNDEPAVGKPDQKVVGLPAAWSPEDLQKAIKNLTADGYLQREAAQRRLVEAGTVAVPHLLDALQDGDLESIERASMALIEIGFAYPPNHDGGMWDRLSQLGKVTSGRTASVARKILDEIGEHRARQAQQRLNQVGVFVGHREMMIGAVSTPRLIVQVDEKWTGDVDALHWLRWLRGVKNARVMGKALRGDVLEHVFSIPKLKSVALVEGTLDENALDGIKRQHSLDSIDVRYIKLSNHQVDQIAATPLRRSLTLMGTGVSSERIKEIAKATPGLKIEHRMGGFLGVKCSGDLQPCIIEDVVDGSAAHEAGLISGDIIIAVDDVKVREFGDLQKTINQHIPGDQLALKFRRGSKVESVRLKLRRYVEEEQKSAYPRAVPGTPFQQRIPLQRMPIRPLMPQPIPDLENNR